MQAVFVCNNRETAQIAAKGNYIAWAQDVYPEECASHMSSLRKQGLLVGKYPTWEVAFAAATEALNAVKRRAC
jgi:hypothetical protein